MARAPVKRPAPLSIRLSPTERAQLEEKAAGQSLSSYIKFVLFDATPSGSQNTGLADANRKLLAHLLATLGASRIAPNLDRLAQEAEIGLLVEREYGAPIVDHDTRRRLFEACDDVRLMHNALMRGLGIQEKSPSQHELSASAIFNAASDGGSKE